MTFIEVTVSDDAAAKIASDLQALDLHAEAACIQVLLRDRDRLRQTLRAVNDGPHEPMHPDAVKMLRLQGWLANMGIVA